MIVAPSPAFALCASSFAKATEDKPAGLGAGGYANYALRAPAAGNAVSFREPEVLLDVGQIGRLLDLVDEFFRMWVLKKKHRHVNGQVSHLPLHHHVVIA